MSSVLDFCYDRLGSNPELGYPNLAQDDLSPEQFDTTWPRVLPLRLLMYLQQFGHRFRTHLVDRAPLGSWYPIALAWHDFDCDYFELISPAAKQRARRHEIQFLFYYHEGDHPGRIKLRFDDLCRRHDLPGDCYLLISANSAADQFNRCCYFNDHEYFLSYINREQPADTATDQERTYDFTALTRIHKWWRATVMSDLYHYGVLDNSQWSYNTKLALDEKLEDNPIRIEAIYDGRKNLRDFINQGPYVWDGPDATVHNDHRRINPELYTDSYCHLVIETLYDVDQSKGTFLTEKTYKCLKFGQPFVIIGPAGSLETLRRSGYRVFDHAIDNDYDQIEDNTARWLAARRSIIQIKRQNLHEWYLGCLDDVHHNQIHYAGKKHGLLQRLIKKLTENRDSIETLESVRIGPIVDHRFASDVKAGIQQHGTAGTIVPGF
jgi:hypothetical protein